MLAVEDGMVILPVQAKDDYGHIVEKVYRLSDIYYN